jgi:hypothetical protein
VSTTYGELKTRIAAVLLDPDGKTFTAAALLPQLAIAGLVEVGRILPMQYTEDIDTVANQLSYTLASDLFSIAEPQVEVVRVEVWDPTTDPESLIYAVQDAGAQWASSDSGWSNWGGTLYLPTRVVRGLQGHEGTYVLRVWGYAPYETPSADEDVIPLSQAAEEAVVKYARLEGLELLLADRDLFSQWQARSGNTDISPAGLMSQLSQAREDWRRYSARILQLRTPV